MPDWTLTNLGELDYLPAGIKVVVGQYLYASSNRRFWAILVIGVFYDSDDNELWRKEIFVRRCETRGGQTVWPQEFDSGPAPPYHPAAYSSESAPNQSVPSRAIYSKFRHSLREASRTGENPPECRRPPLYRTLQTYIDSWHTLDISAACDTPVSREQTHWGHRRSLEYCPPPSLIPHRGHTYIGHPVAPLSSPPAPVTGVHGYWVPVWRPSQGWINTLIRY